MNDDEIKIHIKKVKVPVDPVAQVVPVLPIFYRIMYFDLRRNIWREFLKCDNLDLSLTELLDKINNELPKDTKFRLYHGRRIMMTFTKQSEDNFEE